MVQCFFHHLLVYEILGIRGCSGWIFYTPLPFIYSTTLLYSFRSISLLYESERTGQATAEELLRQKEQLKQTESRSQATNFISFCLLFAKKIIDLPER